VLARVKHFESQLKTKDLTTKPMGCLKLQRDIVYEVFVGSDEIKTSAVVVYVQLAEENYRNLILLMILRVYIKEPFFDELRTRRQLAYNVQTALKNNRGVLGLLFLLVSSNVSPREAAKLMKEFISRHFQKFKELSTEDFIGLKKAVVAKLTEPFDSL
jgi:nardilysin